MNKTGLSRSMAMMSAVAGVVVLIGLFVAPDRTWPNLLVTGMMAIGLGLGCVIFLATQAVTSGGWHTCFKRVPEAAMATLPFSLMAMLFVLVGGMGTLYEWSHADVMATDALLASKAAWLNVPFFLGRAALIAVIWIAFVTAMLKVSRNQDDNPGVAGNRRFNKLSGVFLIVFGLTFSVACFDWLMSLEAHWFSTIFAVYHFAGAFVSGLALITITLILLRRRGGPLEGIVKDAHLIDMGKLMLGLSSFWAYIWLSQYLLIWYSNLPEEVSFYLWRFSGAWAVLSVVCVLVNWVVPFLVLLPRASKCNEGLMLKAAGLLLAGHWLDLFLSVQPVFFKEEPVLGVWELAPLALGVGLFVIAYRRALGAVSMHPTGDVFYEESRHHHL